jgi:hypothetical protein
MSIRLIEKQHKHFHHKYQIVSHSLGRSGRQVPTLEQLQQFLIFFVSHILLFSNSLNDMGSEKKRVS